MIDPNRLARLILDEWQDTEQPIQQRGTILPLGIYEDGSAHLAVPGLIQDGIEGWNALWDDAQAAREGAYPTFDVEQGKRSAGNSLMAAGLAATGGLAAGAAGGLPDNALASNAIRREGTTPVLAYRGSVHTGPMRSRTPYFSSSRDVAEDYSLANGAPNRMSTDVHLRFNNPLRVDAQGSMWDQIPFEGELETTDNLAAIARRRGHDGIAVENVIDESDNPALGRKQTTYAALRPGTVFSATTGEQLFANPKTSALAPMALSEDGSAHQSGDDGQQGVTTTLAPDNFVQTRGKRGTQSGAAPPTWDEYDDAPWYLPKDLVGDWIYRHQGVLLHGGLGVAALAARNPLLAGANLGYAGYSLARGRTAKHPHERWVRPAEEYYQDIGIRPPTNPQSEARSSPPAPLSLLGQGEDEQYSDDQFIASILNRYGNPPTAATVPLGLSGQDGSDDDFLSALLSRYGVSN